MPPRRALLGLVLLSSALLAVQAWRWGQKLNNDTSAAELRAHTPCVVITANGSSIGDCADPQEADDGDTGPGARAETAPDPQPVPHSQDVDGSEPQRVLARRLLSAWPAFAPLVPGVSEGCRNHSTEFVRELRELSLWALKMHDSSAKLPSGILNGNVNQYGDFDQCLSVSSPGGAVRGQYCLAYLQLFMREENPHPVVATIYDSVYSHHAFRSNFDDPGHRVPRFSTINWGVCVPAACSARDVQLQVEHWANSAADGTAFTMRVRVDADMCQVAVPWKSMPTSSVTATAFFGAVLLLVGVATAYDFYRRADAEPALSRDLFLAFSLRKNWAALTSTKRSPDDIESVHGLRFFVAIMLVLCHKSMSVFYNGYSNRTLMTESIGRQWTAIARAASLYTDPFIMLSGLLTSYAFVKKLNRGERINILEELRNRLIRLVPSLAALILFCTLVLPWLGSGPQWNLVIKTHADICSKHWWRNLLFIHNHFGFENMCLTHTHHVGIDTQLFVVSPLFIWLLWSRPRFGVITLGVISLISTIMRFYYTYAYQLSFFVYFGSSISQMFKTADMSYMMPAQRLTVYLMGVVLGYMLRHCGRDFKLKQSHLTLGWTLGAIAIYATAVTPAFMGEVGYKYQALHAANYAAFAPITCCFVFAWIIFTSYTGQGGFLGRLSSWKGFLVCTRLSYAIYLTQFPVFFYNVGMTNAPIQYTITVMFSIKEIIAIFMASAILTLLFEMPAQNVKNAVSQYRKRCSSVSKATTSNCTDPQKLKVQ